MPETSIAITAKDNYSAAISKMSDTTRAFNKNADDMQEKLNTLNKSRYTLKLDLKTAQKELDKTEKQFQKTGKAADELKRDAAQAKYDNIQRNLALVTKGAREAERQMKQTGNAFRKTDNQASSGGFGSSIIKALAISGIGDTAKQLVMQGANTAASSFGGEAVGAIFSNALSTAVTGASAGFMLGGLPGAAAGAGIGALVGIASGELQNFQKRDDAFKGYVQESAEGQLSARAEDISSGSSIAAGREQKQLAFSSLLGGDEAAAGFLDKVKVVAAKTNYTYDEITGYAKSMVKSFGTEGTLDMLTTLSDTSVALSLGESDNSVLIAGLSRMKLTDKTTQEYLNYFSERGIDVYEALSKWGDAASVAEKVTKGEIGGSEAVEEIMAYLQEQYGGLSEEMAGTYEGMMGNLKGAEANNQEHYGIGYNDARKEGIQAQTDWLGSGAMDEANEAIGAWQAKLENQKEEAVRTAVDAAMDTDEYRKVQAEGDAAEMGRIIMQAKVQGINEYNASEGAQLALASEKALVQGIRDDAGLKNDYWDAGYEMGQEFTKGLAAVAQNRISALDLQAGNLSKDIWTDDGGGIHNATGAGWYDDGGNFHPTAYGLSRVPYDNFPALLHQGERVLTASQARQAERAGGGVSVTFTGPVTVREEADLDKLARKFAERVRRAELLAVPG